VRRSLPLLVLLLVPAILLRGSLAAGHFPGQVFGEGWGRLFAAGQVARWLTGEAPPGHGDLLNHPDGMAFWPVDPLTTLGSALLQLFGGGGPAAGAAALTVTVFLLLALCGWAAWLLARSLGAGPWSACTAAVALQLHPYLLRSAADTITEVLALGPLLLLGAAALHAWRGGARRWWLLGAAMLATALTSPYYAIYALVAWVALAPWVLWRRAWRPWLALAGVMVVAGSLAAAPLLLAEAGPDGRLDERFEGGGFQLAPSGQVLLSPQGTLGPAPRPTPTGGAGPTSAVAAERMGPPGAPAPWRWVLHRFPGGLACGLALVMGLVCRRSRPWALLALGMFAVGAGPPLVKHALAPGPSDISSPLQELLQLLPLTSRLGNAQRLVVLYVVPALLAGGIATAARWPWALLLACTALAEGLLVFPALRLPTCDVDVDSSILAAVHGPVVTFPNGDPPTWNPRAPPKRALYLASLHGGPVAGDYGRGREPADQALLATLSAWSSTALAPDAAQRGAALGLPAPRPEGFGQLLVLHESLDRAQQDALHRKAEARWGPPQAYSGWGAVYDLEQDEP
jgi:hypothetical protein